MLFAFILASAAVTAAELLVLISSQMKSGGVSAEGFANCLLDTVPYSFAFFITVGLTDGKRSVKGFWSCLCLYFVFHISGLEHKSMLVGILISLFTVYCIKSFNPYFAYCASLISCVIFGFLFLYGKDYYLSFVMSLSSFTSKSKSLSPALFGALNSFFKAFDMTSFENMFYFKSYGGTVVENGRVETGAVDLFKMKTGDFAVIRFLSGHYYLLFLLAGVFAMLAPKHKRVQRMCLIVLFCSLLLSGNISLFLLFIFLESPYMLLVLGILSSVCYLTANALSVSIGFVSGGSIVEMMTSGGNYVYLLTAGTVFVALGFFASKYIYQKVGLSDCYNIYIPTRLEKTVKALGGINNIIRFRENAVEVRNPMLVDKLSLDCVVEENLVKSEKSEFSELKAYLF